MSQKRITEHRDFSYYDDTPTEVLRELLRLDAQASPDRETDTERLLYVTDILTRRKQQTDSTPRKSWQAFHEALLQTEEPRNPAPRKRTVWLGRMAAAISIFLLLTASTVTASALDWEALLSIVARWSEGIFSFVSVNGTEETGLPYNVQHPFSPLADTLTQNGHPTDMLPTWLPEGFLMLEVTPERYEEQESYCAVYTRGEEILTLLIQTYNPDIRLHLQVEEEIAEIYEAAGIPYYIFENFHQLRAMWIAGNYECVLTGHVTLEEMKQIIDSIEKGQ